MELFQTFLSAIILLIPVFFACTCMTLVGLSRRDCLTQDERFLKNLVIAYLFFSCMSWFTTFCYYFYSKVHVILNVPCLLSYIVSVVLIYRIICSLTRTALSKDFPFVHYLVPAALATLLLVWSFFVPFDVQVEIVESRQLVLHGKYEAYSRLFSSKSIFRALFQLVYITFICMQLVRYYRSASSTDSFVRKRTQFILFLITLLLITMFASVILSFSLRGRLFPKTGALIASFSTSGLYVSLTYHIIRRKYLPYNLLQLAPKNVNKKTGRRVFAGELSRKRLEDWFSEKKPYLNSGFKITDVVDAMDVNRSAISSFINNEYGMNFNRFVNRWRLEEVNRLSEQSGIEPSKLFAQAGFSEKRQYYRAAKSITN